MRKLIGLLAVTGAALALVACGGSSGNGALGGGGGGQGGGGVGGGGGGGVVPAGPPVRYSVEVAWPERTRQVEATASALSAVAILRTSGNVLEDEVATLDRQDRVDAYMEEIVSLGTRPSGDYVLLVRFFSERGGAGQLVAEASLPVTLREDPNDAFRPPDSRLKGVGLLTQRNGQALGTIVPSARIAQVEVPAGQLVDFENTSQLSFVARDASDSIVAVTPGSARFAIVSGGDKLALTPDGLATGLDPGVAEVTATVDNVTSPSEEVRVVPARIPFTVDVAFPLRSRNVSATASALSFRAVMQGAGVQGEDVAVQGNRPADVNDATEVQEALVESFTSTPLVLMGDHTLNVQFFSELNTNGVVVAEATVSVTVRPDGVVVERDGDPLVINPATNVGSVVLSEVGPMRVSNQVQIEFEAFDMGGNPMNLTDGSAIFEVVTNPDVVSVTPAGVVTATELGTATVRANVDGVLSNEIEILVRNRFAIDVEWLARSRAGARSTNSALSTRIVFRGAELSNQDIDVEVLINRDDTILEGYTETVQILETSLIGRFALDVFFYPNFDGLDLIGGPTEEAWVARDALDVMFNADGSITRLDGLPVGTLSPVSEIESVVIPDNPDGGPQFVRIGEWSTLTFQTFEGDGDALEVTPGSGFWRVVEDIDNGFVNTGEITLDPDGRVRGISRGAVWVQVTVDSISSELTQVVVDFPADP